jgi:type I restriction enzyme S subunit
MAALRDVLAEPMRTGLSRLGSEESTHRVLTLSSVRNGRLDMRASRPIDLSVDEGVRYRVRPSRVYVVRGNGRLSLVGRGALSPDQPGEVVFPDLLIEITPDNRIIDPEYLSVVWNSPVVRKQIEQIARTSAGIHKVNLANLSSVTIPLPTIEQQGALTKTFAAQLKSVGALEVASTVAQGAVNAALLRAYEEAFGATTPLATSLGAANIPSDWAWWRLTDLARLESGHTPSRSRPDWWGGDIPWVQLADIRAVDGQVINSTRETTNAEGIMHSAARILPADTVVMSRTASVGFVARLGRPMATSQDFVNWVCGPNLDPEFLMRLLIRSREYVRSLSAGAIHQTVYYPTVKDFHVCIPPVATQRRIAAELAHRIATLSQMSGAISEQAEAIGALPDALLRRALEALEAA